MMTREFKQKIRAGYQPTQRVSEICDRVNNTKYCVIWGYDLRREQNGVVSYYMGGQEYY